MRAARLISTGRRMTTELIRAVHASMPDEYPAGMAEVLAESIMCNCPYGHFSSYTTPDKPGFVFCGTCHKHLISTGGT